jgi:hypothetical protein
MTEVEIRMEVCLIQKVLRQVQMSVESVELMMEMLDRDRLPRRVRNPACHVHLFASLTTQSLYSHILPFVWDTASVLIGLPMVQIRTAAARDPNRLYCGGSGMCQFWMVYYSLQY